MEIIRRNTDYGIRALVYLALHRGELVSAGEIAESQGIPIEFLQKILNRLVRCGLVASHRGVQGGFQLAREPGEITLLEVVEAMQGKLVVNKCFLEQGGCPRSPSCRLKSSWLDLERKLAGYLKGFTLRDLMEQIGGG